MDRCVWLHSDGSCRQELSDGTVVAVCACPYSDSPSGQASYCDMFVPDDLPEKTSSIEKRASWADVAAKGRAIAESGGVDIVREDPDEIEAFVTSVQVAGSFPVSMGGPYDVILSKRSWENSRNVGGWVQGYLCDCEWGRYNSGQPGAGWHGRFCSHAYATLLESNSRARGEFMRNRTAGIVGECEGCGKVCDIDPVTGLCADCGDRRAFAAFVGAVRGGDGAEECERYLVSFVPDEVVADMADNSEIRDAGNGARVACWRGFRGFIPANRKSAALDGWRPAPNIPGGYEVETIDLDGDGDAVIYEDGGVYGWDWYIGGEYFAAEGGFESLDEAKADFEDRYEEVRASKTAQEADAVVWDGDDESQLCELPDGGECEVFENADGEWVWELYSASGEYVDSGRGYGGMEEAKDAFERSHDVYRMASRASKSAKVYCIEYTYDGDSLSDYIGHVAVEAESVEDALSKAEAEVEGGRWFRYEGDEYESFDEFLEKYPGSNRRLISMRKSASPEGWFPDPYGDLMKDLGYGVKVEVFENYDEYGGYSWEVYRDYPRYEVLEGNGKRYGTPDEAAQAYEASHGRGAFRANSAKAASKVFMLNYNTDEDDPSDPFGYSGTAFVEGDTVEEAIKRFGDLKPDAMDIRWGYGFYDSVSDFREAHPHEHLVTAASKKEATRTFSFAEMEELDREIEGKPLNNADRLKAPIG